MGSKSRGGKPVTQHVSSAVRRHAGESAPLGRSRRAHAAHRAPLSPRSTAPHEQRAAVTRDAAQRQVAHCRSTGHRSQVTPLGARRTSLALFPPDRARRAEGGGHADGGRSRTAGIRRRAIGSLRSAHMSRDHVSRRRKHRGGTRYAPVAGKTVALWPPKGWTPLAPTAPAPRDDLGVAVGVVCRG